MHYKQDTRVFAASGEAVGKIDRVVMDPKTRKVTFLVVRKGLLFTEDKVVPIEMVRDASDEFVTLDQSADNLEALPLFEETQYLPFDWKERPGAGLGSDLSQQVRDSSALFAPSLFLYPGIGMGAGGYHSLPDPSYKTQTETNIPGDAVTLKTGAVVVTQDDKVLGSIDEVITNGNDNTATHFVISVGMFFKTHKAIPVQWIQKVLEDEVRLGVDADWLEQLPDYKSA